MTTASTEARSVSQSPSAGRLLAAVGMVLGATAFTVQAFVQSTGGEGNGPDQAAHRTDAVPAPGPCSEQPLELTLATERHQLSEGDALPLAPRELRPASAEG